MKKYSLILGYSLLVFLLVCCKKDKKDQEIPKSSATITDTVKIAKDAYLYSLPLILMDITRRQMTDPSAGKLYAPINQFRHNNSFPDAAFKNVVRPNADTYYSIAWLDLSDEPIVLSVPNTNGRYYMMPMMDAYSNVFYAPGSRTTGNDQKNFIITSPKWKGTLRADMTHVPSPTNIVWIIGRTQVNSKKDGEETVIPLQNKFNLSPLSSYGKTNVQIKPKTDTLAPEGDPNAIVREMYIEKYFNYANELIAKNPPPKSDTLFIESFKKIGVGANLKFLLQNFSKHTETAIKKIPKEIFSTFDNEKAASDKLINGWNIGREIIGSYGMDFYSRASTAYFGLGANLKDDAVYPSCYFDQNGEPLNGNNQYVIHFGKGKFPPVNAFWSLTAYDPDGYFIENSIKRYTLGDRSSLKINTDGSLDIYIQKSYPDKKKMSNWLPCGSGNFNLLLRLYWPNNEILTKSWIPPNVQKVNKN